MFWADKVAKEIIKSGKYKPYWVDDMFTPSGYAHVGSLLGPLLHDLIYKAITDAKQKTTFTYVFNDFDPIDGLPSELLEKFKPYFGYPLRIAPSPEPEFKSFAEYFTEDFKKVLQELGVQAKFLSSWDMYHEGKFNEAIRTALDISEKIQEIYRRVSGSKKQEQGWLPLQVICPKCHKLGTTHVNAWDGKLVKFSCELQLVKWAQGCGYSGQISPFDGNGKLPWKVDWPAHWKVLGVTIEGAGKDHASRGGSYDIAFALCEEVFHIPKPYYLPYEHFLLGGKKMSSSKGIGLKARNITSILPAALVRFLFTRTDYRQSIEFNPVNTLAIPDLYDEYDRSWQAYNGNTNDLARVFELAQVKDKLPRNQKLFIPRFRDVATYIQLTNINLVDKFTEIKGSKLMAEEINILLEREKYARIWIDKYAPDDFRMQMTETLPLQVANFSNDQKKYLKSVVDLIKTNNDGDKLQVKLYQLAKKLNLDPQTAFSGIYLAFLGRTHGPRAAWFLLQYPKDEVINRLNSASSYSSSGLEASREISILSRPDLFTISNEVREKYPSVSVGIALIKNVTIAKTNSNLEIEKQDLLTELVGLTTAEFGKYSEIISYRNLYKEMGVDWHSRRPSPEALLRRVALGKGLYTVNTCVDAYNLVVMRNRVSVGAFDTDRVKFPTRLCFAEDGDKILLLGDIEPTTYSAKEIAYYDGVGGYNIDFNYRDAQRTMVTEQTKNLWINVDGVYDITPDQVFTTLKEAVEKIVKYCGGTVEIMGVVK